MHTLAFALGASAEKAVALASARGDGSAFADWRDPDSVLDQMFPELGGHASLHEAVLSGYEAEAWRRAARDPRWDVVLGCVLSQRGAFEFYEGRRGLGGAHAARALRIFRTTGLRTASMHALDVTSILARRRRDDPSRIAETPRQWSPRLPHERQRTWALSVEAGALAALGRREAAMANVERILERATSECTREDLAWGRAGLVATIHLEAGAPRAALAALDRAPNGPDTTALCVRVYHANGLAVPDEWMGEVRTHLRAAGAYSWHGRTKLAEFGRRQAGLQRA